MGSETLAKTMYLTTYVKSNIKRTLTCSILMEVRFENVRLIARAIVTQFLSIHLFETYIYESIDLPAYQDAMR